MHFRMARLQVLENNIFLGFLFFRNNDIFLSRTALFLAFGAHGTVLLQKPDDIVFILPHANSFTQKLVAFVCHLN